MFIFVLIYTCCVHFFRTFEFLKTAFLTLIKTFTSNSDRVLIAVKDYLEHFIYVQPKFHTNLIDELFPIILLIKLQNMK